MPPLSPDCARALDDAAALWARSVASLIEGYARYLSAGHRPLDGQQEDAEADLAALASGAGAFDWLADEPDLYTAQDGEAYGGNA